MSDARLQELYLEAVDLPPGERTVLLDRVQAEDPEVARTLARLLAVPEGAPSPIDGAPRLAAADVAEPEPPPERVGPYRIVGQLGQGGMGRVYLAEQETPDFRRRVALKLIHQPQAGADTVRRFRDEVRILASLEHPGIVRFYDGGRSAEGVWFLAQEVVEGVDLIAYAEAQKLGTRERVALFRGVVEAVAFAHRQRVVHRDIKPSNVLVDRDGRPRLLDFGISKLLGPGDGVTTTLGDVRPLTPAYASPEQLAGDPATVASDVFSLGIVLYELLTGERPPSGQPTPAPSQRAQRTGSRRVPARLDTICLRALAHDPADRYPSAVELAEALASALDGSEVGWRARRGFLVAALAALAILVVAAWQMRDRAVHPPQVVDGANGLGFPFDPANPPAQEELEARFAETPGDLVAGSALVVSLARERRFDEAALVVARLRQLPHAETDPVVDYAEGYLAHRRREPQRALLFYTRARDHALAAGRSELLSEIRGRLATQLSTLGQRDAAIAELELALAAAEGGGDALGAYRNLNDLAIEYLQQGDLEAGEGLLERALDAAGRAGVRPLVVLGNLAAVQAARGRPDLAEARLRTLLELRKLEPSPLREAQAWLKLHAALRDLGRLDEAGAALERALELLRSLPAEHDLGTALYTRGLVDLEAARLGGLDPTLGGLAEVTRNTQHRRPLGLARELEARRAALAGDLETARTRFAEGFEILRAQGDGDLAARLALAWALAEAQAGDGEAALGVLDRRLADLDAAATAEIRVPAETLRVRIAAAAGRIAEAEARLARLGPEVANSPSLAWRFAYQLARGVTEAGAGRVRAADRAFALAREAANARGAVVDALEVRLIAVAAGVTSPSEREAIAAEARRLGLAGIARRADELAAEPRSAR